MTNFMTLTAAAAAGASSFAAPCALSAPTVSSTAAAECE